METIKPSNLEQALKQVTALEKKFGMKEGELTSKVPEKLNLVDCKNHYHAFLLKRVHDQKNARYITSGFIQSFGKGPSFEKVAKSYGRLGYSNLIVLHDPTTMAQPSTDLSETDLKGHEKSAIKTQIEKEEKEAMQKRIDERVKAAEAAKVQEKSEQLDAEKKKAEKAGKEEKLIFEGLEVTEANVDQFAKDNNIDIKNAKTADGKLAIVKKFIESKTK